MIWYLWAPEERRSMPLQCESHHRKRTSLLSMNETDTRFKLMDSIFVSVNIGISMRCHISHLHVKCKYTFILHINVRRRRHCGPCKNRFNVFPSFGTLLQHSFHWIINSLGSSSRLHLNCVNSLSFRIVVKSLRDHFFLLSFKLTILWKNVCLRQVHTFVI